MATRTQGSSEAIWSLETMLWSLKAAFVGEKTSPSSVPASGLGLKTQGQGLADRRPL